jgi:2,5-diamino-6-(ribosylamino)-4(3H)-pyrimidinone 5'-phosphate reductase
LSAERPRGSSSHKVRRPFVLVNTAITADGKIATVNRAVSFFTSAYDQQHLLELRATADAVMCGARTVSLGTINLGPGGLKYRRLRQKRGLDEYNLRVIVSGSGKVNPRADVFRHRFSPIVVLASGRITPARLRRLQGVADEVKICGDGDLDFPAALAWLRERWQVKRLLCEGGGELNAALFHAGLVDELHLTIAPKIFGGRSAPTLADGIGAATLAEAVRLQQRSMRRVGDELFLVYRVALLHRGGATRSAS